MFVGESSLEYLLMEIYAAVPLASKGLGLGASTNTSSDASGTAAGNAGHDYFLLESMGYRIGLALVERYIKTLSEREIVSVFVLISLIPNLLACAYRQMLPLPLLQNHLLFQLLLQLLAS